MEGKLSERVKQHALELGFHLVGIAPAVQPPSLHKLDLWLSEGCAGTMEYLQRRRHAYEHPNRLLKEARSVVVVALSYNTDEPAEPDECQVRISRYAWGQRDYHSVIRERLRQLGNFLHQTCADCRTRVVVDTAPLLEREFAQLAGLGWIGKNTMLINPTFGSWLFLGALLTNVELEPDEPFSNNFCGNCRRCLKACPTQALSKPWWLDARRCISYLTIEQRKEEIPRPLASQMGCWIFGCDVCQEACPWNRKALQSNEPAFKPRKELNPVDLEFLLKLTPEQFDAFFADTPILRTGRSCLFRNVAVAVANWKNKHKAIEILQKLQTDPDATVRKAAAEALARLSNH